MDCQETYQLVANVRHYPVLDVRAPLLELTGLHTDGVEQIGDHTARLAGVCIISTEHTHDAEPL